MKIPSLLLPLVVATAASGLLLAVGALASPCSSTEVFDLLGDSSLILTQEFITTEENENNATKMISIELVYEGHAWLGFGFSRDGRMIGSTVVVGIPENREEGTLNVTTTEAQRYYLADKNLFNIRPFDPEKKIYYFPPSPPAADDDGDFDDGWRRQLEVLPPERENRELLVVKNSSIVQNETHTILKFHRPWEADPQIGVKVAVHPDSLNTIIYAVGSSNTFGYHPLFGSHSFHFSSTCGHGTLAPANNTDTSGSNTSQFGDP